MAQQVVCDTCGEIIDQSISYFRANVQTVQMIDGVLIAAESVTQLDYHTDHLPGNVAEVLSDDD
jgi:hypothetical protein